jgi:chromosome segregation ATPase
MLHDDTDLVISKPILIISGANGSGKTQILEALMVLLGEKSPRSKKGLNYIINDKDKECLIEIEVNNVRSNGDFVFQQLETSLKYFLSLGIIAFRAKLSKTKIRRFIGDPTTGKYKEITLRTVQKLFSQIGIRPNNQLTFTLGETVDVFSNQSNYKKFNVLIENLGLAELKQEIVANEKGIKEATETTSRLQRKLKEEEENLELFRTMIDTIQQREKLESQIETLTIERNWIDVFNLEKTLLKHKKESQLIFDKFNLLKEKLDLIKEDKEKINTEKEILTQTLNDIKSRIAKLEAEIREKQKIQATQEGTINVLSEQIIEYKAEINVIDEYLENIPERRHQLQISMKKAQEKQKALKDDYRLKTEEIISLDENSIDKKSKMYNYEISLRDDAIKLKNEIINQNLDQNILGPLISYIRLADTQKNESWLPAIKRAIGNYLYSFIALDSDSFKQCKYIYDSVFTEKKPGFEVFRFDSSDAKSKKINSPLYAFVPDLLEGDPRVLLMLKKIMTTALSEDKDPNILLDAAITYQVDVLTKDTRSFYRRKGSFSRPPRPFNGDLGVDVTKQLDFKDIRKTRKQLEKDLFQIKKEETDLIKEIADLRNELNILQSPDKERENLKLKLNRATLRIDEAKKEIQEITIFLKDKKEILEGFKREEASLKSDINSLKNELIELNLVMRNEEIKLESQEKEYNEAKLLIKDTQDKLDLKIQEVSKIGPRPDEIRDHHEVDLEFKEIQTKLALVKDKSIPRDKLEAQEKKVVELRDNLIERRDHLEHLREDIEERVDKWKRQIEPFIIQLSETLQGLTKNIFAQVKLEIDNPDLEKAGLELSAVTKGDFRHDQALSGGEKVLLMECLILALHASTTSPLHVIDEFTQRLDAKNKAKIFLIVKELLMRSKEETQFILITPDTLGIEIEENIQHVVVSQAQIIEN